MSFVARVDAFQRRHPKVGLPAAVFYKFFDDQGSYLSAVIAYYGIVSIFPLLLLASTIASFVLQGDPHLQQELINSAASQVPVVGQELTDQKGVRGSGIGLLIGVLGTIYGSLGVGQAVQNAMNNVWRVPRNSRPNPFKARGRSLVVIAIIGFSVLGTTALTAVGTALDSLGFVSELFIILGTFVVNSAVFTTAFRVATARPLTIGQTLPGATLAAAVWQLLQYAGSQYVTEVIKPASAVNSVFALVLGLIAWVYLEALVVVLSVEFNTVRTQKLYPRALLTPFTDDVVLTPADERAYAEQAKAQRFKGFEAISVVFSPRPKKDGNGDASGNGHQPALDATDAERAGDATAEPHA